MKEMTITYTPKITSATTEYRTLDKEDLIFVQSELVRWSSIMNELDVTKDEDYAWARDHWWHKKTKDLPRSKEGLNTPASFIGGVLNNTVFGTQRDLTAKQMDAIQSISNIMASAFDTCTYITFEELL